MYPNHFKANMTMKNTQRKCILINLSTIKINMEFKTLLGHRRC